MFKRNEGTLDRIARLALGTVLLPAGLFWLGALQGNVAGLLAAVLGVIALVTALTGFCPTYVLFGFDTLKPEKKQSVAPVEGR
jgi:hypothetical protein